MELLIILVVMVVVSVVVYFQLKGSKPEVLTVSDLTVPYNKKKEKKEAKVEKKVVTEQWDKAEVVKRDASPGEAKRRKNKPFDPVKEGLKVVAAKTDVVEGPAALSEKEEKAQKKRLEADGFVVVKEKAKPVQKVADQVDAVVEEPEEEVDLSPAALRLAQLKAIIQGSPAPGGAGGPNRPRDSSPNNNTSSGPKKVGAVSRQEIPHSEIAQKLQAQKAEADKLKASRSTQNMGGKAIVFDAGPSKLARWAKAPLKKAEEAVVEAKAEAVAEPVEEPKEEWVEEAKGDGSADW